MSAISIILILFVIYFKNMVTCADSLLYFFALGARELKLVFNSSLTNKKNLEAYILCLHFIPGFISFVLSYFS